jgi:hypothetical protein
MYLITRVRTADPGKLADAIEWSIDTRNYVNDHSAFEVSVHLSVFGKPTGTVTFATIVESRAQWISESQKLLGDSAYMDRTKRGAEVFLGPAEDSMRQILHVNGISVEGPRPPVTQTWTAQIARFQFDAAMAWAVEVTDYVVDLTGVGIALAAENYGDFGTLAWIAGPDSAEQADAMNEAMLADAGWRKMVANAADLFIDGKTRVWLNRTLP